MTPAEKVCAVCLKDFTPHKAEQESCSRACAAFRRHSNAKYRGGKASAIRQSAHEYGLCRCQPCGSRRGEPIESRAALIALVAAQHGVPVATGPAPKRPDAVTLARRAVAIRRKAEAERMVYT